MATKVLQQLKKGENKPDRAESFTGNQISKKEQLATRAASQPNLFAANGPEKEGKLNGKKLSSYKSNIR